MQLEIAPNILNQFAAQDVKVFFYEAGCEGWKVDFTDAFDPDHLQSVVLGGKNIYFSEEDAKRLDGGKILLKSSKNTDPNSPHTPSKYMFLSPKVQSRCSCATSVAFEKKLLPSVKLKNLRKIFRTTLEKK